MSQSIRILLALTLGLLSGIGLSSINPQLALTLVEGAEPIGSAWLHGLQMVIVPLIVGLLDKGFCFRTLAEHPAYQGWIAQHR